MGLSDFIQNYGGRRVDEYAQQPSLEGEPADDSEEPEDAEGLDYEVPREDWDAVDLDLPDGWRVGDWDDRPIRFVDGKDIGETVAWLCAPGGYPVPVRLSQIGGVVVRLINGECRREFVVVDKVVSMVADLFPWDEVESFAAELQENGFRLLPAQPPENRPSYGFEKMRKAAQNRSNDEMGVLEEAVLAQDPGVPTIVDGRLEPRIGGFDPHEPVFGVVKRHHKNYLHPVGMQLLYQLEPGQRTPVFRLPGRLEVVSWYVRLAGGAGSMPNWGLVRVEAPRLWFERRARDWSLVDRLSHTLREYRCRDASYARAPVSLHPIVRAEESLGSLFHPGSLLTHRFYRLTAL
ncbi:MAG: hypothetical protein ACK47B_12620 [Armatimonadota bacterium]